MCAEPFETQRTNARFCSDKCRQRARRAGVSAQAAVVAEPVSGGAGSSAAAALSWLRAQRLDADRVPAAADLLVVAEAIDTAKETGQIQFIAALSRQAAALRAELVRDADDGEPSSGQEVQGGGGDSGNGVGHRSVDDGAWDPSAI